MHVAISTSVDAHVEDLEGLGYKVHRIGHASEAVLDPRNGTVELMASEMLVIIAAGGLYTAADLFFIGLGYAGCSKIVLVGPAVLGLPLNKPVSIEHNTRGLRGAFIQFNTWPEAKKRFFDQVAGKLRRTGGLK